MDRCELAWVAGFFDGEGWANAVRSAGRRTSQPQARVNQADAAGVPAALVRMRTALGGLGRIAGPQRMEGRIDLYRWEVSSRADVQQLNDLIAPWLGQVKLDQLTAALGCARPESSAVESTDEWRAWAAGLYDGEGSLYLLDHRSHDGYKIAEMAITQASDSGVPEVLERFVRVVGTGHIYGPYRQSSSTLAVYRWKSVVHSRIDETTQALWPWLGPTKRAQASVALSVIRSQPQLPRGRPEWGHHKTHCVHGHEYAVARVRPYRPRGRGIPVRENHRCLRCLREYAQIQRRRKLGDSGEGGRSVSERAVRYLLK